MIPQFDPIWAWPWVVLAAGASLAVVIATYPRRIAHLPPGQRRLLMTMRLITWAILTLAMLRPWLEITEIDRHASTYLVVADNSRSMSVKDGLGGATRRETVLKMLEDAQRELDKFDEEIKVQFVDFGKEVAVVEKFGPETPGEQTAIGHMLDALPKLSPDKKVVGVLLITDGAQRALPPFDNDPRAAANRLAEQQIRVDTIGVGASGISDSALDLSVEDLEVSPTVFVKNTVVVRAKVRAVGAAGQELTVRLLLEDRATAQPDKSGTMRPVAPPKKIKPGRPQDVLPVEMDFIALDPGEFKLTVEVVPLDFEGIAVERAAGAALVLQTGEQAGKIVLPSR